MPRPRKIAHILGEPVRVGLAYWLHVGEREEAFPINFPGRQRSTLTVTVVGVGDGWVDEVTRLRTVEEFGLIHHFHIVAPRGRGWERDAEADNHVMKWTAWRRRRTWALA